MTDDYKALTNNLKRFVNLFFNEYAKYLDKEQLEIIKNIDFDHIIHFDEYNYPLGRINLKQIYFSNNIDSLINTMKKMKRYGSKNFIKNNKNFTTYLQSICDLGYQAYDYYNDQLLYLIFMLVRRDVSGFNNGVINYEICYLDIKYNMHIPNIYHREEALIERLIKIIGHDHLLHIIFKSHIDSYMYLKNNLGYRYAELYNEIYHLINHRYAKLDKDYVGTQGYIDYAKDYDSISYGDVYNCLLDFAAREIK